MPIGADVVTERRRIEDPSLAEVLEQCVVVLARRRPIADGFDAQNPLQNLERPVDLLDVVFEIVRIGPLVKVAVMTDLMAIPHDRLAHLGMSFDNPSGDEKRRLQLDRAQIVETFWHPNACLIAAKGHGDETIYIFNIVGDPRALCIHVERAKDRTAFVVRPGPLGCWVAYVGRLPWHIRDQTHLNSP